MIQRRKERNIDEILENQSVFSGFCDFLVEGNRLKKIGRKIQHNSTLSLLFILFQYFEIEIIVGHRLNDVYINQFEAYSD